MNTNSTPPKGVDDSKTKAAASSAAEDVKASAQDMADQARTAATDYADQAKGAAADEVGNVGSALRTAAEELRSGSPQERTFSQIADGLADASDALREKDLGEMVGAVNDFAKRNPLVFLSSAALIGFAATRFAKASSSPSRSGGTDYAGGTGYTGGREPMHTTAARPDTAPTPAMKPGAPSADPVGHRTTAAGTTPPTKGS